MNKNLDYEAYIINLFEKKSISCLQIDEVVSNTFFSEFISKSHSSHISCESFSKSIFDDSHLFRIYMFEKKNQKKQAATYTTILMHYAVRCESTDTIDEFFNILDKSCLTSWSLIALLRTTYTYRKKINNWKDLYNFTYTQVEKEGLSTMKELYGLDN